MEGLKTVKLFEIQFRESYEPLERTLQFEIFKKLPVISLYWFAAQQQTSTCRRQKSRSIYSKFSVEWSELTPSFQNALEVASKLQKPSNARKT